jgi:hypothetical protein
LPRENRAPIFPAAQLHRDLFGRLAAVSIGEERMANGSVVIAATTAEADRIFADAVTTAGGFVQRRVPGQPVHFKIKNTDGFANLIPLGTGETRVDVSVSPPAALIVGWGGLVVAGFLMVVIGFAGNGLAVLALFGLIIAGVAAYKGFQGVVTQPPTLLKRIVGSLSRPDAVLGGP